MFPSLLIFICDVDIISINRFQCNIKAVLASAILIGLKPAQGISKEQSCEKRKKREGKKGGGASFPEVNSGGSTTRMWAVPSYELG